MPTPEIPTEAKVPEEAEASSSSLFDTLYQRKPSISTTSAFVPFSPDEKVAAAIDASSGKVYLLAGDGRQLLTLNGNNIIFPCNGKELLIISGNEIYIIPIHPNEIEHLLDELRIPGFSGIKEYSFVEI